MVERFLTQSCETFLHQMAQFSIQTAQNWERAGAGRYIYSMNRETFIQIYGVSPERVAFWISGVLRQVLQEEDLDQLDNWIIENITNQKLYENLIEPDRFEIELEDWNYQTGVEKLRATILAALIDTQSKKKKTIVITMVSLAVAASVALILFFTTGKNNKDWWEGTVVTPTVFLPGGSGLQLDEKGNRSVEKDRYEYVYQDYEGILKYEQQQQQPSTGAQLYVFKIPAIWKYWIFLDDKSEVCLHNGAAIRYRQPFEDGKREVEVRGEFFFEISGNQTPFVINFPDGKVTSPGGKLYVDIAAGKKAKIVLLDGAASVYYKGECASLAVGQIAKINGGSVVVVQPADTSMYVTRKDGVWRFTNELTLDDLKDNLRSRFRLMRN
jgi:ferric-dicitrate binding protein FerR (iron transport regulator)